MYFVVKNGETNEERFRIVENKSSLKLYLSRDIRYAFEHLSETKKYLENFFGENPKYADLFNKIKSENKSKRKNKSEMIENIKDLELDDLIILSKIVGRLFKGTEDYYGTLEIIKGKSLGSIENANFQMFLS